MLNSIFPIKKLVTNLTITHETSNKQNKTFAQLEANEFAKV